MHALTCSVGVCRMYLFKKHFPGVHFGECRMNIKLNLWENPAHDNSVWQLPASTWTEPSVNVSKYVRKKQRSLCNNNAKYSKTYIKVC